MTVSFDQFIHLVEYSVRSEKVAKLLATTLFLLRHAVPISVDELTFSFCGKYDRLVSLEKTSSLVRGRRYNQKQSGR